MRTKSGSEGVAVNEGQHEGIGSTICKLHEQELCLWGYFMCMLTPLWRHPPKLASGTGQEALAV